MSDDEDCPFDIVSTKNASIERLPRWRLGMNFEAERSKSSIIHVFPFSSEKKRGGSAVRVPESPVHKHWKGAAEIVLASCSAYINADDQLAAMDDNKAAYFRKAIDDMAP